MNPIQVRFDDANRSDSVSESPSGSNPFCTRFVRPGAIEFLFQTTTWGNDREAAMARIVKELADRRWGVIVGAHGSGKSTLVQSLLPELQHRFCEVKIVQTHAPTAADLLGRWAHRRKTSATVMDAATSLPREGLIIVDGIEQLGLISRWRLIRIARRNQQFILATSHRDLWPFSTLFRTQVTADLIANLTEGLLANVPEDLRRAVQRELRPRRLTTLENVRELWFDLYDVVENLPETSAEPLDSNLH